MRANSGNNGIKHGRVHFATRTFKLKHIRKTNNKDNEQKCSRGFIRCPIGGMIINTVVYFSIGLGDTLLFLFLFHKALLKPVN